MPNTAAYAALIIWPFIALACFARMPPSKALVWSLLGGYLLLPMKTSFDFPGVPALDKTSIANLSAMVGALTFAGFRAVRLPREWWLLLPLLVFVAAPMFTVFANGDVLVFGDIVLPALKPYDALSQAAYSAINVLPFILGYNLLRGKKAANECLRAIAVAALFYSLLMLIEIRLSPQLHTWIYGFFPHSFGQQFRWNGFRPVVFLGHGLLVAIFTSFALVAMVYFAKIKAKIFSVPAWVWAIYIFVLLIFCRTFGALVLGVFALGLLLFMSWKHIRIVCALLALATMIYPVLRGADLVPVDQIYSATAAIDEERAGSFRTRVDNEDQLLARAQERPLFGWGGYGRNRVFDEDSGADLSVTDGTWIIVIGTNGWIGYLATFGLLCLPIIVSAARGGPVTPASVALSLILAINLLDLIPNSSLSPLTWLLAGSLVPVAQKAPVRRGLRRGKAAMRRPHRSASAQPQT